MKKAALLLIFTAICALAATACGNDETTEESESSEILIIDNDTTTTAATQMKETEEQKSTQTTAKTTKSQKTATTATAKNKKSNTAAVTAEQIEENNAAGDDEYYEDTDVAYNEPDEIPPEATEITLGDDCTEYVNYNPYLGFSEGISCIGEGYDRVYDYGDYMIYTFADYAGTGDYVQEIDLVTDKYTTSAGIYVGCSRADVEAAYGESESYRYGLDDGNFIEFLFDGDTVTLIMYCLG